MSNYYIGDFGFVRWEGPRPQFVKQHVQEFTKGGQDGISAQLLGTRGDPFQVQLSAVMPSVAQVAVIEANYRLLIGTVTNVIYEGMNYTIGYRTQYLVHDAMNVSVKRHPLLFGPGYNYPGGWKVVSRWILIPVAV